MRIGEVLKQARARAGLDIRAVEEQTKIRVKYLRALEDEEWDALPSAAYAKGFLRTYAQLLGLDGEALADAYRRQVERGRTDPHLPRRPGARAQAPALGRVAGAALAAGRDRGRRGGRRRALLAIGLLGDDDDEAAATAAGGAAPDKQQARERDEQAPTGTVTLGLLIREPVQICLVGGGGQALIDGQVLNPGDEESYERKRFELRFPSGFDGGPVRARDRGQAAAAAARRRAGRLRDHRSAARGRRRAPGQGVSVSVRAGILVTGTEVITARITDRNGPWISERLAELGVEVAHILVVGDRPDDLEAGLRFMADEGCELIVTSGGLGPTADDLTAEIVARFAGVEMELDEGMEEKIAADHRRLRAPAALRPGGDPRRRTESRRWSRGAPRRSTRSARRRGSWSPSRTGRP